MVKVSVVVPTFMTPAAGLQRLVRSLDGQTMPMRDFEVIFVDDGSPDDTFARLREVQSSRPNVRVERIENSGWPSKPRNVGIDLAAGEYIAFMDHDDELYPDALRAAHAYATEHHADVVNGKEAYTNTPHWGLGTYVRDEPQSLGRREAHPLLPMNPHKLYRTQFLRTHEIRFPEGRNVFWEDAFFNIQVARHAQVISTLASVPYYHWVVTKGSGSTRFVKSDEAYWRMLRRVIEAIELELDGPALKLQRDQLLRHQYVARVLGVFNERFPKRSEAERLFVFEQARSLQQDFDLSRFDDSVGSFRKVRASLLRAGSLGLMVEACIEDPAVPGRGRAIALRWEGGVLRAEVHVEWGQDSDPRFALRREGDRIVKSLSPQLIDALPAVARDMTAEIEGASIELSVRSRESRIVWLTPTHRTVSVTDDPEGVVTFSALATSSIDPERAAMGNPLDSAHWDLFVRARVSSAMSHTPVRSDAQASVTVLSDRLHLMYPTDNGNATIIPDGQIEAVRRLAPVHVSRSRDGHFEFELSGRHDGEGSVSTVVGVRRNALSALVEVPATLTVEGGLAKLLVRARSGAHVRIGDRALDGPIWWTVASSRATQRLVAGPSVETPPRGGAGNPGRVKKRASAWRRARSRLGRLMRRGGLR